MRLTISLALALLAYGHTTQASRTLPLDGAFQAAQTFVDVHHFETANASNIYGSNFTYTTVGAEVIEGNQSLKLQGDGLARIVPIVQAFEPNRTYSIYLQYRVITPDASEPNLKLNLSWQGGSSFGATLANSSEHTSSEPLTLQATISLGDVSNIEIELKTAPAAEVIVDNLIVFRRDNTRSAKAPKTQGVGFPRLGRNFYDNPLALAERHGVDANTQLELASRFHVVTGFQEDPTLGFTWVPQIRQLSPEIIVLPKFDLHATSLSEASIEGHAGIQGLFAEATATNWHLKNSSGGAVIDTNDSDLQLLTPSAHAPNEGTLSLSNFRQDFVRSTFYSSGLYDGIYLSSARWHPDLERLSSTGRYQDAPLLDLDGDSSSDSYADLLTSYADSYLLDIKSFQPATGSAYLQVGASHGRASNYSFLASNDGQIFESTSPYPVSPNGSWNTRHASLWYESNRQLSLLKSISPFPQLNVLNYNGRGLGSSNANNTPLGNPDRAATLSTDDYRRSRFGLTSALLQNAYFNYDLIDSSSLPLWFDEYAVAADGSSTGNRFGRNYLGQPLSDATELTTSTPDIVFYLDFSNPVPAGITLQGNISNDASDLINGSSAFVVENTSDTTPLNFLQLDPAVYPLETDAVYHLFVSYKTLSATPTDETDLLSIGFDTTRMLPGANAVVQPETANQLDSGHLRAVVQYDPNTHSFGGILGHQARIAIDNLSLIKNPAGIWRRDFENGIVLTNPTPTPQIATLDQIRGQSNRTNITRIRGIQDITWNNGTPVTSSITLAPGDAIVLLADRLATPKPSAPTNLAAFPETNRIHLTWTPPSQGAVAGFLVRYAIDNGDATEFTLTSPLNYTTIEDPIPDEAYTFSISTIDFEGRVSSLSPETTITTSGSSEGALPRIESGNAGAQLDSGTTVNFVISGISPSSAQTFAQPYPTEFEGITFTINGRPAQIVSLSQSAISVVTPSDLLVGEDALLRLSQNNHVGPGYFIPVNDPAVTTVGSVTSSTITQNEVTLTLDSGAIARVSLIRDDTVRVRVNPAGTFSSQVSGAIIATNDAAPTPTITENGTEIIIESGALIAHIYKSPFKVETTLPDGTPLSSDRPNGIGWRTDRNEIFIEKTLQTGERILGLGLRGGPLDRRGDILTMRNTDRAGYFEFDGPLYTSTPFYLSELNGTYHGVFADMPATTDFDIGHTDLDVLQIKSSQQEVDYYLFSGSTPADILNAYGKLTGFAPLPPKWSLGFQQSRYGYDSWDEIQSLSDNFRTLEIPVDAIYLDLDWLDELEPLTWDPIAFANPADQLQNFSDNGFRIVNIVDLFTPKTGSTWSELDTLGLLLKDSDGNSYSSNIFIGDVGWIDITHPTAAQWYIDHLIPIIQDGVAGVWNDLNEPADNYLTDAIFDFDGEQRSETEARNLFALRELPLTQTAMLTARPNERPFILSRAGYAGAQRYAAFWSGDTLSSFESLRVSIQNSLHMSLSGVQQFGHDIGGFLGSPSPELFTRWLQFGSYTPFFRNHTTNTTIDSEPWQFGAPYTGINREIINQRYRLLPYWYSLFEYASQTGDPVIAPTFLHFPNDAFTHDQDDCFMLGPYMLIAPVYTAGATDRTLYLPAGNNWHEQTTGTIYAGGQSITVNAPLTEIPVFVRDDAILPSGPVRQYAGQTIDDEFLQFDLYSAPTASFTLYEDDGISFDHASGDYLRTTLTHERTSYLVQLKLEREGNWTPPARDLIFKFHETDDNARIVYIDGQAYLGSAELSDLDSLTSGWHLDATSKTLTVKSPDGASHISILIDTPPAPDAVPHVYYFDRDGDRHGNPNESLILYQDTPFQGMVMLGDDTDDSDDLVFEEIVDQGTRLFGMDLFSYPENGGARNDELNNTGIDVIPLTLYWSTLEDSPYTYNGSNKIIIETLAALFPQGTKIELRIHPIVDSYDTRPTDLSSLAWDAPETLQRFNALLSHLHSSLSNFELHSLQIGQDVDLYFEQHLDNGERSEFLTFLNGAKTTAQSLWGSQFAFSTTLNYSAVASINYDAFYDQLIGLSDVTCLSFAPIFDEPLKLPGPWLINAQVDTLVERFPSKPIHLINIAYPSDTDARSSQTKQSQFIAEIFRSWDEHIDTIPYLSFDLLFDRSPSSASTEASNPRYPIDETNTATYVSLLGSQGLRSYPEAGTAKPAYSTLRNAVFERGWNITELADQRTILLGLTSDPYDLNPGDGDPTQPFIDSVMDETFSIVSQHADLLEYHFDKGVPWPEAYADDFSSAALPYSTNVNAHWKALRDREPAGMFTAVSINPLGLPRKRTAAYWGYGEGFYLDANADRTPTGIYQDYNQRIPPGDWSTHALDSEPVKTAYLNYAKRTIDYFNPDYLILSVEANEVIEYGEALTDQYLALHQFIYESLKADPNYAQTKLMATLSAEFFMLDELDTPYLLAALQDPTLTGKHQQFLEDIAAHCDVIGLSMHPIKLRLPGKTLPIAAFTRLFSDINRIANKPIAITETGYPSESFQIGTLNYSASEEKQDRYLKMLLSEAEKAGTVEFILNYGVKDFTPRIDKLRARATETPPFISPDLVDFFKIFEHIGLFTVDGQTRPMTDTWIQYFSKRFNGQLSISPITLQSPDGQIEATITIDENDQFTYEVTHKGVSIIEPSQLGVIVDNINLGTNLINIEKAPTLDINETYPTKGARSQATDLSKETNIALRRTGDSEHDANIVFRMFNDGFAFRYQISGEPDTYRSVSGETTNWNFPPAGTLWLQDSTGNYESQFHPVPLGELNADAGGQMTIEFAGDPAPRILFISEAALKNYSGMTLHGDYFLDGLYATFLDDASWPIHGQSYSPWRYTIISEDLNGLIQSDITTHLNDAPDPTLFPQGTDTPWIRGGRSVWSWWSEYNSGGDYDLQEDYIDAAAEMGVEFTTIDIYWEESFPYGGKDQFERLSELVDYAHSDGRNVDIWVWKNWFDIIDPVERATFMDTVKAAGVVGLKCDLVFGQSSESYGNVLLHEQILIDAAERELMINFHGTHKAHGLQRTYPNEITREGLSGLENNGTIWETLPEFMIPPSHNVALLFTRFLSGPGDYTPATFDSRKIGDTTFTHQLSTVGLFTSPLITLADHFQILQAQTDVLDILLGIPSEWDETLALEPSKIGELAILARRRGSHWWIFAINGDAELATTVTDLDLTFLDNVEYTMTTVSDATQTSFNRNTQQAITADSTLTFNMLAGGGFVARLSPQVSFSQWAADYFPEGSELALPLANPDGDSMNNLIEFALGGNPTLRDLSLLPQPKISAIGEQQYLSFTHSLREDLHQLATGNMGTNYTVDGINYTLETSPDLATWTSESEDITIVGTPAPNGDGTVSVTFRMTQAIGPENQAQFIRLTLSLVP